MRPTLPAFISCSASNIWDFFWKRPPLSRPRVDRRKLSRDCIVSRNSSDLATLLPVISWKSTEPRIGIHFLPLRAAVLMAREAASTLEYSSWLFTFIPATPVEDIKAVWRKGTQSAIASNRPSVLIKRGMLVAARPVETSWSNTHFVIRSS